MKYFLHIFGAALLLASSLSAYAVELTPSQLQMAATLSSSDKVNLAKQAGITLPTSQAVKASVSAVPKATVLDVKLGKSAIELAIQNRVESLTSKNNKAVVLPENVATPDATASLEKVDDQLRHAWQAMLVEQSPRVIAAKLSQYGYQLFSGSPTTFAPAADIPVPAEYVLGPGDELNIQFYGSKEDHLQAVIDREGMISLPAIGALNLVGLHFQQAKALIAEKIHQHAIGVTASVSMGRLRSMRVFVLGDVNHPGSYVVSGLSTISNALFVSGGISKQGSLRHIMLKRSGKTVAELDLYDFLLQGNSKHDIKLLPGDVVFVPPLGDIITIAGEVNRPAIYELKKKHVYISSLLTLAGGTLATADMKHVQVDRITGNGDRRLLDEDVTTAKHSMQLKNGDIVLVYPVPGIKSDTVQLTGHVKRSGSFGFKSGMRLSDLIHSKQDLLPYAFMDYMIIQRTDPNTGALTILRPSLSKLLDANDAAQDLVLKADDKLIVFSNVAMSKLDSVMVTGAVLHPGKFPLGQAMHVSDLILAAGGPSESAYLKEVELTRYKIIHGEKRVLEHIQLNLQQALAGTAAEDILLQPYDVVMLRSIGNWRAYEQIELKGEFKFPGIYTIEDGETLAQVIKRAGGVTDKAFMPAAMFMRESIRKQQEEQLKQSLDRLEKEMAQMEALNQGIHDPKILLNKQKGLAAAKAAIDKMRKLKPQGRLMIDMDKFAKLKGEAKLKLADGDVLLMPKQPDQILIIGEVYNQSAMLYRKNMNRDDYLDLSGGITKMADEDSIYIVRANGYIDSGRGWNKNKHIYPGDTIVVPQNLEVFNLLDSTLDWSKVLMQFGVFTAAMRTVGII